MKDFSINVAKVDAVRDVIISRLLARTPPHAREAQLPHLYVKASIVAASWVAMPDKAFANDVAERLATLKLLSSSLARVYIHFAHYRRSLALAPQSTEQPPADGQENCYPVGRPVIVDSCTTKTLMQLSGTFKARRACRHLAQLKRDGIAAFLLHSGALFTVAIVDWEQKNVRFIDSLVHLPSGIKTQFMDMLSTVGLDPQGTCQNECFFQQPTGSVDCLLYALMAAEAYLSKSGKYPNHRFPLADVHHLFSGEQPDSVRRKVILDFLIVQSISFFILPPQVF